MFHPATPARLTPLPWRSNLAVGFGGKPEPSSTGTMNDETVEHRLILAPKSKSVWRRAMQRQPASSLWYQAPNHAGDYLPIPGLSPFKRASPATALPARHVPSQVPLSKPLQQHGVDVAVCLHEDCLVRVDVGAEVAVLVQEVVGPADPVAEGLEARGRVGRRHDDVDLVPLGLDERRDADLGVHRLLQGAEARGEPDGVLRGAVEVVHGRAEREGRVEEDGHADVVGREEHRLQVHPRVAVERRAHELQCVPVLSAFSLFSHKMARGSKNVGSYLDLVGDPVEESVGPAAGGMHREERPPDARVHGDEPLVPFPQIVLAQHLAHGADIETLVVPLDHPDVRRLGQQVDRARLAVENEDEISIPVQPILDEKGEVLSRVV